MASDVQLAAGSIGFENRFHTIRLFCIFLFRDWTVGICVIRLPVQAGQRSEQEATPSSNPPGLAQSGN